MRKKLYVNVDRCEVVGGADALTPIVQEMDRRLQELASETEAMKAALFKYANTNESPQYKKCAVNIYQLSNFLYEASGQLNDMQLQIVKYQVAMARYNDKSSSYATPNPHTVKQIVLTQDSTTWKFTYEEMLYVDRCIEKYTKIARDTIKHLHSNNEAIGAIWRDPQYRDFSDFINEIVTATLNSVTVLEEYATYLNTLPIQVCVW